MSDAREIATDGEMSRIMRDALDGFIKDQVVGSLGSPKNLLQVQVRPVGTHRYRANVFVGKDVSSARIANSFFLSTDADGNILSSCPEIVRLY
jgi:hypothetical protein